MLLWLIRARGRVRTLPHAKQQSKARGFYIEECIKSKWSTRQLERQINTLFYERLLSSQDKKSVVAEIEKTAVASDPKDFIRSPVVLEFLGMINVKCTSIITPAK